MRIGRLWRPSEVGCDEKGQTADSVGHLSSVPLGKGDWGLPLRIPNRKREHAQRGKRCCIVTRISHGSPVLQGLPSPSKPSRGGWVNSKGVREGVGVFWFCAEPRAHPSSFAACDSTSAHRLGF